ncbi:MAG: polysaccharide export protein [Bacteroidetes bacterium]|nr:polysaccharide export protein [Bacteroidota bacterium]
MKVFRFYLLWLIILVCAFMTGCVTPKQLAYFQEGSQKENTFRSDSLIAKANEITIVKGLILTIRVNSITPDDSSINPFEPILIPSRITDPPNTPGFLVDDDGNIALPLVGVIPAAGKTTTQLANLIRTKLQSHLKEPTVTVSYTTRISVLGEVNKPGVFVLNYPAIILPEALGLAGDLTSYARRDNILIIRSGNGINEPVHQRLDLTKEEILKSPYYLLQSGDVVYVSPGKARAATVDRTYQIIPIALSAITVIAAVLGLALR